MRRLVTLPLVLLGLTACFDFAGDRGELGFLTDARIDLHGMTQDAAYRRLHRFLETARADGARMVLVITGKGGPAEPGSHGTGRGVLRRAVPEWLRSPAYTPLVSGYHSAGPRHGGEGALYVRLRGSTRPRRTAD